MLDGAPGKDFLTQKAAWAGHTMAVVSLALSASGACLASSSLDCTILLRNVRRDPPPYHRIRASPLDFWTVAFRPDGRALATGAHDGVLRLYEVPPTPAPRVCVPSRVHAPTHGCIRREGTSEAAPEAVRQAVGGGCQSGWGRLLSVTNAMEPGACRQWLGTSWVPWRGGDTCPPSYASLRQPPPPPVVRNTTPAPTSMVQRGQVDQLLTQPVHR